MSYQVLARKWRPKFFDEVVGQDHVVRALKNALTQQRLHHAYLFAGTRGVGKTTLARILAKCLNCETGLTASPCGKCDACLEIDNGSFMDLIEVDAASRTKVEDTRDLLDNVQYLPAKGRYKVYIIDEVHMLSGHSFNALLKTLEEPPAHVKFLLATTDPQKLPVTVLSRCLQFNLKALQPELIQLQLANLLTKESVPYEEEALYLIAKSAKGSVRDSLSLLDQALAFSQNNITISEIKEMLGSIDTKKVFDLLQELANGNTNAILTIISELAELSCDFMELTNEFLEALHNIAIFQLSPQHQLNKWHYPDLMQKLATQIKKEDVQLYYQIALNGKRDLNFAPNQKSGFEMMMMRMLAFRPTSTEPVVIDNNKNNLQVKTKPTTTVSNNKLDLLKLNVTGATQAMLRHCVVNKLTDGEIEILLDPAQAPLLNKTHEQRIQQALIEYYNKPLKLTITLGSTNMPTADNIKKTLDEKERNAALRAITNDQSVKEILDKFGAKIIDGSIKNNKKST